MLRNGLWGLQRFARGADSWSLPVLLVCTASSLVLYRHMTEAATHDPVKTFLVLILLQMLPLVWLEMKIVKCPDPVGVLSMFGEKVLLMYMCFLLMRVFCLFFAGFSTGYWNTACLVGVCVALRNGFNFQLSLRSLIKNMDVVGLVVISMLAAVATGMSVATSTTPWRHEFQYIIDTASNYIELLTFVPAVWIAAGAERRVSRIQVDFKNLHTPAIYFFTFLISFYFMEDLCQAFKRRNQMPFASVGHVVHFLLLLDFATFMLTQIVNPDNIKRQVQTWLPQ